MGQYAATTDVSVDKSRAEIERILSRYGAEAFMYGWDRQQAVLQFQVENRLIRFVLTMPDRDAREFTHTPTRGTKRTEAQAFAAWEQACKQRWRALALVIKAKLEAVESGIAEFEDEFLAHVVLPDGTTAGQWMRPQIDAAYTTGQMPEALPALPSPKGGA